ncbi:MAG TPA: hypothetical protein VGP89_06070 [Candidatus Angelobacter sp.]|jgi:gas vesicle protein|nr:hypothetical protein [Candidatus Angelobacter sp.]
MTDYLRSDEQKWHPGGIRSGAIGWLLAGIAIGAGAALLLLPSTRHELRSALASGYRRTINGVSRGTQQLRQHGSNLISFTRRSGISGT